jgi:hypothetical protein
MGKLKLFGLHLYDKEQTPTKNENDMKFIVSTEEDISEGIIINGVKYCVHNVPGEQHWYMDYENDRSIITFLGKPDNRVVAKFGEIDNTELSDFFVQVFEKM